MHIIQCVGSWHAYSSSGKIDAWEREYFSASFHRTHLFLLLTGMVCIVDTILLYYKFAYMGYVTVGSLYPAGNGSNISYYAVEAIILITDIQGVHVDTDLCQVLRG